MGDAAHVSLARNHRRRSEMKLAIDSRRERVDDGTLLRFRREHAHVEDEVAPRAGNRALLAPVDVPAQEKGRRRFRCDRFRFDKRLRNDGRACRARASPVSALGPRSAEGRRGLRVDGSRRTLPAEEFHDQEEGADEHEEPADDGRLRARSARGGGRGGSAWFGVGG